MSIEIGKRIKLLRKQKGLKQDELAAAIGVSASAVSNYEQGTREPKGDTLKSLVEVLDTTPDYLLWGKEPDTESRPLITPEELQLVQNAVHLRLAEPIIFGGETLIPEMSKDAMDFLCSAILRAYVDVKDNKIK